MSPTLLPRSLRVLLAIVYAAGIFYGGVIDIGPLPKIPEVAADKVLHALAFLGLALVLELALMDWPPWRRRATAVAIAIAVGGALELVQSALPYRSAELADLLADAVGAIVGTLLATVIALAFRRRMPPVRGSG